MSVDQDMPGHAPSCADVHDLTAGFAFGALDPDDLRSIEQHCANCPSCADTVQQARQTAVMLSFAVRPMAPPPVAKAALFARIAQQDQSAAIPQIATAFPFMHAEYASSQSRPQSRSNPQSKSQSGRFHLPFLTRSPLGRGKGDRARPGWSALTAPFATVPLMLALVVLGAFAWHGQTRIDAMQSDLSDARGKADRLQSTLDTIDSLVADVDSRVYYLPPQNAPAQQGYGKVYAKPGASLAVLMVWGLQSTASGSGYQVMLESRSGQMVPCGNFRVDRHGNGSVLLSFDRPFTSYESVRVMPMPVNSTTTGNWTSSELLSAPINPIVGQPGDTDPPQTK